jgi:2-polyprenyl-3-methyl-5-hydroxy-6-metoxy-1,4-benzoquinol methylase
MEDLLYHLARYKFIGRQIRKNWDVLEIGCGTGYGSNFLAQFAKTVNACELDTSLLVRAKEKFVKPNLTYSDAPVLAQYDVVVCLEVIEHMTKDYAYKLLDTLDKNLKPGGLLFISTPRKIDNPSENRKKYHLHEYTAQEFIAILEERFTNTLLFSQNDEIISTQNPENAWNYMAVCFKSK